MHSESDKDGHLCGNEPVSLLLHGAGLFSGIHARVRLSRAPGPIFVSSLGREASLNALAPRAEGRTSALVGEGIHLSCVEHLFSALAGLGIRHGLRLDVDAAELPLLDGGASAWTRALRGLGFGLHPERSRWRVARAAVVQWGRSRYRFEPHGDGERHASACDVRFDTEDHRLIATASWDGSGEDFEARIAPARTFVDERELESMLAAGYRATVDPESVVVLGARAVHSAGRPFEADEPARHKLLDLIGDLALHGGPPVGRVSADRPGHAATHHIVAQAIADGIVVAP